MGLGGYLMWTAVAREYVLQQKRVGCNPLPILVIPYESVSYLATQLGHLPIKTDEMIFKGSEVWVHNPRFEKNAMIDYVSFYLMLNDPKTNYCKLDTPERAKHRYDMHVVRQICNHYKLEPQSIRPELFLTRAEDECVTVLLGDITLKPFVTIEPHSKQSYTVNRGYPFDKWQRIVDALRSDGITVVQVGIPGERILDGVVDTTGKTSFRTCAGVIGRASLHLSAEGGLMHAAAAMKTPAVIVVTGYQDPKMTCYPWNTNIWVKHDDAPCGMKIRCDACHQAVEVHDECELIDAARKKLGDRI